MSMQEITASVGGGGPVKMGVRWDPETLSELEGLDQLKAAIELGLMVHMELKERLTPLVLAQMLLDGSRKWNS